MKNKIFKKEISVSEIFIGYDNISILPCVQIQGVCTDNLIKLRNVEDLEFFRNLNGKNIRITIEEVE